MKHFVYNCAYFVWRSGEVDPFTSWYDIFRIHMQWVASRDEG